MISSLAIIDFTTDSNHEDDNHPIIVDTYVVRIITSSPIL